MYLKTKKIFFYFIIIILFLGIYQTTNIYTLPTSHTLQRCNAFNYGESINIINNNDHTSDELQTLTEENNQLKKRLLQLENQSLIEQIQQKTNQNTNNYTATNTKTNFLTKLYYYYFHHLLHFTNDNLTLTNSIIDLENH